MISSTPDTPASAIHSAASAASPVFGDLTAVSVGCVSAFGVIVTALLAGCVCTPAGSAFGSAVVSAVSSEGSDPVCGAAVTVSFAGGSVTVTVSSDGDPVTVPSVGGIVVVSSVVGGSVVGSPVVVVGGAVGSSVVGGGVVDSSVVGGGVVGSSVVGGGVVDPSVVGGGVTGSSAPPVPLR